MNRRFIQHLVTLGGSLLLSSAFSTVQAQPLVAGEEYAAIGYNGAAHDNPIARLAERLESGETTLHYDPKHGYFEDMLKELGVSPSSQTLVYSPTSLQYLKINADTPRAIYFSEDVYVGWVVDSTIVELMAMDDKLGLVFYIFHNAPERKDLIERESQRCLVCHDSTGAMGGGIPVVMAHSGIFTRNGSNLRDISGDGMVTDRTPLAERWGGWYVTGQHGGQTHLGNLQLTNKSQLEQLDVTKFGNVDTLTPTGWFDTSPYLRDTSDIVALMVLEHQLTVQNQFIYVKFKAPVVLDRVGLSDQKEAQSWDELGPKAQRALTRMLDNLVQSLFMIDAIELTDTISGSAEFAEWFQAQGEHDSQGRSLRELDLEKHLFRYPLSYLVESPEFDALPPYAIDYVYRRMAAVLTGADRSAPYDQLSPERLNEALQILRATKPSFEPYLNLALSQN